MRLRRREPEPTLEQKLASVEQRLHVLEALALAMRERAVVLQVVDASDSMDDAVVRLGRRLGLDELQARAVLDMQLRLLVPAEVAKIEAEVRDAREQRDRYLREGARRR